MFSKNEYIDYKNKFLSLDFITSRTIKYNDYSEIGLEIYELNDFKNKKEEYVFNIYDEKNMKKIDSIILLKRSVKLLESNPLTYR